MARPTAEPIELLVAVMPEATPCSASDTPVPAAMNIVVNTTPSPTLTAIRFASRARNRDGPEGRGRGAGHRRSGRVWSCPDERVRRAGHPPGHAHGDDDGEGRRFPRCLAECRMQQVREAAGEPHDAERERGRVEQLALRLHAPAVDGDAGHAHDGEDDSGGADDTEPGFAVERSASTCQCVGSSATAPEGRAGRGGGSREVIIGRRFALERHLRSRQLSDQGRPSS